MLALPKFSIVRSTSNRAVDLGPFAAAIGVPRPNFGGACSYLAYSVSFLIGKERRFGAKMSFDSITSFGQLIKYARKVFDPLGTRNQMLTIEYYGGYSANAFLNPKVLHLAHFRSKLLPFQHL